MRSVRRALLSIFIILVIAAGIGIWWFVYRPLPQVDGTIVVNGLHSDVSVERDRVDRAADRVSDLRDQAQDLYTGGEDHTLRNVLTFAAGVGVGIGAGMLFAPASGEEIRGQIGDKVHDIGDRVRSRFSSEVSSRKVRKTATGTEGR